jgi:hypothetical protein
MNRILLTILTLMATIGCGTIPLGTTTTTTHTQQQLDSAIMFCQKTAENRIQSGGFQTAGFFVGFLFPLMPITYPILRSQEVKTARASYATCMAARGLTVTVL